VVVDNSILAPVFQQPLLLGADICMTSATKFIGGHSDVTAGILSIKGKELADRLYFLQVRTPATSALTLPQVVDTASLQRKNKIWKNVPF
jgi:cystathionine beta-lyase/cystathionine gamma-synthase